MAQMYVVMGRTGEYSDRTEWLVAVYDDRAQAETHVALAECWLREHQVSMNADHRLHVPYDARVKACPYDDAFRCDYTGTAYYVLEVERRDTAPEPEKRA
jgi:hypothetical protein